MEFCPGKTFQKKMEMIGIDFYLTKFRKEVRS